MICYLGTLHPGAHEPLIEPALFDQVQSLLKARNIRMTRHVQHAHHLRGLLHCGNCGSRMLLDFATNPRGTTYAYFVCSGRAAKKTSCTRRAVPVQVAEHLVEDAYAASDDGSRRLANQAFYTRLEITEDEQLRPRFAEPFATIVHEEAGGKKVLREHPAPFEVACPRLIFEAFLVDAMERYGNRRQRVERLVSAWNQGIREGAAPVGGPDDPLIDAPAEPRRRPRTRLTDSEVDAMRTARAHGTSVNARARRFGIHRGTVWAKTRRP